MKKVKRYFRVLGFVLLIVLACTGMGLTGVGPLSTQKRQVLPDEIHVEMVEKEEEEEQEGLI